MHQLSNELREKLQNLFPSAKLICHTSGNGLAFFVLDRVGTCETLQKIKNLGFVHASNIDADDRRKSYIFCGL